MKIVQYITPDQKEQVILLFLKGYAKTEIVKATDVSWWHVNDIVYRFQKSVSPRSYLSETLEELKKAEENIINKAVLLSSGELQNPKEYETLLACFASADLNNHNVFLGKI